MKVNIKYRIIFKDNSVSEDHEINIDKCVSISLAKIKLEHYLEKKYNNFYKLIVDKAEEKKSGTDKLNDMMGGMGSNLSNPFGSAFGDMFGRAKN